MQICLLADAQRAGPGQVIVHLQQMHQVLSCVLDLPQSPQLEGGSTTQEELDAFVAGAQWTCSADLLAC